VDPPGGARAVPVTLTLRSGAGNVPVTLTLRSGAGNVPVTLTLRSGAGNVPVTLTLRSGAGNLTSRHAWSWRQSRTPTESGLLRQRSPAHTSPFEGGSRMRPVTVNRGGSGAERAGEGGLMSRRFISQGGQPPLVSSRRHYSNVRVVHVRVRWHDFVEHEFVLILSEELRGPLHVHEEGVDALDVLHLHLRALPLGTD